MRYLLILSLILFSCSKEEEINFKKPYQLWMSWQGQGYGLATKDHLWTKRINLSNEIFLDIDVDYGPNARSNYQQFDIDITKLSDTIWSFVIVQPPIVLPSPPSFTNVLASAVPLPS